MVVVTLFPEVSVVTVERVEESSSSWVLLVVPTTCKGAVGGVKLEVYTAVPLTYLKLVM